MTALAKTHGLVFGFEGPLQVPRIVVCDPVTLKDVLVQRATHFVKPALARRALVHVTGDGLLIAEGKEHTRQRRILSKHFEFANLKVREGVVPSSCGYRLACDSTTSWLDVSGNCADIFNGNTAAVDDVVVTSRWV